MTLGAGTFSGKPVRRVEDPDLLRGAGTYVDNMKIDGMLTLLLRALADGARDASGRSTSRRPGRCPEWWACTAPTTSISPTHRP